MLQNICFFKQLLLIFPLVNARQYDTVLMDLSLALIPIHLPLNFSLQDHVPSFLIAWYLPLQAPLTTTSPASWPIYRRRRKSSMMRISSYPVKWTALWPFRWPGRRMIWAFGTTPRLSSWVRTERSWAWEYGRPKPTVRACSEWQLRVGQAKSRVRPKWRYEVNTGWDGGKKGRSF